MIALARGSVTDALSICTWLAFSRAPLLLDLGRARAAGIGQRFDLVDRAAHAFHGSSFPFRQV
jgi:hypothetical protein